ncbi:MAG: transcription-repair coupling factor [Paludibacteraceae bacterium]|nr:transcription-repair coupling factor [Paludibacteraceae bacterium]
MCVDELIQEHEQTKAVADCLRRNRAEHVLMSGLYGSARAAEITALIGRTACAVGPSEGLKDRFAVGPASPVGAMLIVMSDQDSAQYMYSDLRSLTAEAVGQRVLYFPSSRRRSKKVQSQDEAMMVQRTGVLTTLTADAVRPAQAPVRGTIVVTYPEALVEAVPEREDLTKGTIVVKRGDKIQLSDLSNQLSEMGFERVDFVFEPGQYAIRGGIADVYSYSNDDPYRLDFFGNEIDSIRTFDIEDQLSKTKVDEVNLVGPASPVGEATLLDYLPKETIWVSDDWRVVKYKVESFGESSGKWKVESRQTIEFGEKSAFDNFTRIQYNTQPQPSFNKNFEVLADDLKQRIADGYTIYILADQRKQLDRMASVLEDIKFTPVEGTLHEGWIDHELKTVCYTDHEIFERYHRVSLRSENARRGKAIVTLREINQLQLGDYVVHSDHGVGQFGGLVTTTVNGKPQEMVKLTYRDGDTIFVSIHNLHRISKYKGREGSAPTISKLGSGAWERLKERTKDKVKDIARDLIKLYATRKQQQGFAYLPDGYMQQELEASFIYEDTPDQAKATADVKRDMESPMPMDRLICGDVGFGKTEIAMRAAFKAATDGKQTAVLVPTTVLALQHYNTFRERFKDFPVKVEYLSRGKSAKETKDILDRLKKGEIDILVGTHKLVGKTVEWKDLGLLIIDEEQKFGVAVKEKLKSLRTNVDVLTLTATPIPRTLQFSMLGARDLSVMTTPPPNRYPVQTEVLTPDDEDIIKEAIDIELERNGQVFVVNNRIEMLDRIAAKLHRLCPTARIITAHGQMPTDEMEERLEAFINYDYDILVSTTIIESGVDIPNVNTMIIYSAQHYGLADLHQLRGRVGRSNRKAYCYLVAPERELLTPEARRRLDALSTFSELGSGFNLAMQDLDIRGAGNLLGAEQSGFIAELGYDTYQKVLNEAVAELKEEMGTADAAGSPSAVGPSQATVGPASPVGYMWTRDCQLESDLQLCFPSDYIENISERIALYQELDGLRDEDEMTAFKKRLIDRFGPLPDAAEELLNVVRLRWICCRLGIEKIFLKAEHLTLYLTTTNERYWQSDTFGKLVSYCASRADRCRMVEDRDKKTGQKTGKRYITIANVKTVAGAINLLSKIETL